LLAARASATHAGKTLRLAAPADGALHAGLVSGGFLPDAPDAAFWNGAALGDSAAFGDNAALSDNAAFRHNATFRDNSVVTP